MGRRKKSDVIKERLDPDKRSERLIAKRMAYRATMNKIAKAADSQLLGSRQVPAEDQFSGMYGRGDGLVIIEPPYAPDQLYMIVEESGILPQCIEAYVTNIDGFGQNIEPIDSMLMEIPEAVRERETRILKEIIEFPNPESNLTELRKNLRRDLETTGNAYLEVIRNVGGTPTLFYWADARRMRVCALDPEFVTVEVTVPRNGKMVTVPTKKRFRRYAQLLSRSGDTAKIKYFKEFGDPRVVCALTGKTFKNYQDPELAQHKEELRQSGREFEPASEILHFKIGTGTYGIPRWIGEVYTAIGLNRANFVNFDLFDNQGIPPFFITIAGGQLTEESWDDLITLMTQAKGTRQFNKGLVLEVTSVAIDDAVTDTGSKPHIAFHSLLDYRKDDAMFQKYIDSGRTQVRETFRLPALFVGKADSFNYATAAIARAIAEEQIFKPERDAFDLYFHRTLIAALGVRHLMIRSKGPELVLDELAQRNLPYLIQYGAFTVDELIEYANRILGENMQLYDQDWSRVPIPLLQAIVSQVAGEVLGLSPGDPGATDQAGDSNAFPEKPESPRQMPDQQRVDKILKMLAKPKQRPT